MIIFRICIALLVLITLASCAVSDDKIQRSEYGFIVARIGYVAEDAQATDLVSTLYAAIRKIGTIQLVDVIQMRIDNRKTPKSQQSMLVYQAVKPGDYTLESLSVVTPGLELHPTSALPITIAVKRGTVTYIGALQLHLKSEPSIFARIISRSAEVTSVMDGQQADIAQFHQEKSVFADWPVEAQNTLPFPHALTLTEPSP